MVMGHDELTNFMFSTTPEHCQFSVPYKRRSVLFGEHCEDLVKLQAFFSTVLWQKDMPTIQEYAQDVFNVKTSLI